MDFLKTLALPQSLQHYRLVIFMMAVMTPMLVAYAGALLGTAVLSLSYVRRGRLSHRKELFAHAGMLINYSIPDKGTPVLLGIIPSFALLFLSAQVLQDTVSIGVTLWMWGAVLFACSAGFLYAYKFAFHLGDILGTYESLIADSGKETLPGGEGAVYHRSLDESGRRYGNYGVMLAAGALFLVAAAIETTTNPAAALEADSFFAVLISGDVWLQAVMLFVIAAGMTGTLILSKKMDPSSPLITVGYKMAITSLAVLPVVIVAKIVLLSSGALSGWLFTAAGGSILMLFAAAHAVYALQRDRGAVYGIAAFLCFAAGSSGAVITNQLAMSTSTQEHAATLAIIHEKATEDLRSRLGIVLVKLTGDDIYNAKCSACHLFDQKKVGPPYLTVLPKYQGKKAQLVAFILNPQKVNPAYPSMPNQGLKPVEADSIASYILRRAGVKP